MTDPNVDHQAQSSPPRERGGWWHNYVCPVHGVELEHVQLLEEHFPRDGVPCRHSCQIHTEAVRGAWLVLSHQAWARRARLLSHRWERHRDAADRAAGLAILTAYAEIYAGLASGREHDGAEAWMLRGRMFQQALTDAVWGTSIAHAAWSLAKDPTQRDDLVVLLPLLDDISDAAWDARRALVAEDRFSSNYVAWLNAAGATSSRAAALIRSLPWQDDAGWLAGEHGQLAHLSVATAEDGWEWEGSTYYHGFVLRAYLLSLRGETPSGLPTEAISRLATMINVLARIATVDGTLPALHDGPYRRESLALEWEELGTLARALVATSGLDAVITKAKLDAGGLKDELTEHLSGWFDGQPVPGPDCSPERPSSGGAPVEVYDSVGLAVLDGAGIHALFDFGPHGGSHGHHDKLALFLYGDDSPWQPDAGQVPYGHPEWRRHYHAADNHPTIRIDGAEPGESTGYLIDRTAGSVTAGINDQPWYDRVSAIRHLALGDDHLLDVVHIQAGESRTMTLALRPDVDLITTRIGRLERTVWSGAETLEGWHRAHLAEPEAAARLIDRPGPGPADDPQRMRQRLDWTAQTSGVTFCSVFQPGPTARRVIDIRLKSDRVIIDFVDGTAEHALPFDPRPKP